MKENVKRLIIVVCCVPAPFLLVAGCQTADQGSTPTIRHSFELGGSGLLAPKGAPWTLECLRFRGPDAADHAEQFAAVLQRTGGIDPGRVVVIPDPPDIQTIYYGLYYRTTDPETGQRNTPKKLEQDRKLIKSLSMMDESGTSRFPFLLARAVRVPRPDVGPPEWCLKHVDARYSLQVAAFEPTDEFWDYKEAAVAHCRMLRERGYEAYYHHGEGASIVTVGAFGAEVLTIPQRGLPIKGSPSAARTTGRQGQALASARH